MKRALESVNERILVAAQKRSPNFGDPSFIPRLVAVSKLKPVSALLEAYQCGQRYFGENYIQELEKKSNSSEVLEQCPDIRFHFIGHLQSNKVNKLMKIRNLHMVESIDSTNLADLIDKVIERHRENLESGDSETTFCGSQKLKVMIQVNTSGEEQKNGIEPDAVPKLAQHIVQNCPWLELKGLMTIGKLEGWPENDGPNKDFLRLYETRNVVSKTLSVEPNSLELSMGMSSDFEEAITLGSTSVRVGTLIFGQRPSKQ